MQHQVHRPDAKHRLVGIETMEHLVAVMFRILFLEQGLLVVLLHELRRLHDKPRRTHRRVANRIVQIRLHHLDHHADNVSRRTELPVVAACGHLAQHILINVAHRIAVVHVEPVDTIHNLRKRACIRNQERGTFHEAAVRRFLTVVQRLDEREHIARNRSEHRLGILVLEHMPAEALVRNILFGIGIAPVAALENSVLERNAHDVRVRLFRALAIVQHLHEEQVSHLLQNRDGVRDAARPKSIPDGVYAVLDFASNHVGVLKCVMRGI